MKRAVICGVRAAALVDAPEPQPQEDWVLVKVHAAPMCTEYKAFVAGDRREYLGHEAAGEVVAVARPGRVQVGDRVVVMPAYPCGRCRLCIAGDYIHCEHMVDFAALAGSLEGSATYAQYLLKPDWLLPAIPDGVSYEHASLACCALGPTFGALHAMGVGAFDTVLITGAGPVGLGGVVNARFRGVRVIVAEFAPGRAERARQMGATVVDPRARDALQRFMELTGGVGVDCAVECSGVVAAQRLCIDATRRKGQVAFCRRVPRPAADHRQPGHAAQGADAHRIVALQPEPVPQGDAGHSGVAVRRTPDEPRAPDEPDSGGVRAIRVG
ncbi:MAG: alcohol dehydrogenase catalytic domain-containing protein [Anaerolineae bacterium]|nr:alcohol dehydrogenase catalytic domain-containing protein [Anaerolineae bacterium]